MMCWSNIYQPAGGCWLLPHSNSSIPTLNTHPPLSLQPLPFPAFLSTHKLPVKNT